MKLVVDKLISLFQEALIDEPEIGLHPSGQTYLKDELIKIAKNNIVFVSTHSIFMIDKEQVDRHLLVSKKKEITEIRTVESSNITEEEVVYKALGYSLFEMLRPKNIIFEGWRDKRVFEIYLKQKGALSPDDKRLLANVGCLHSLGVKDIPRVANMCENFSRDYIIISDSDRPALEKKREHQGLGKWITYKDISGVSAITTEDFISKKNINRAIKDVFGEHKIGRLISIDDDVNSNFLEVIENHLKSITEEPVDIRKIMNDVKDNIVENLKADDLNDEYKEIVKNILENISSSAEN